MLRQTSIMIMVFGLIVHTAYAQSISSTELINNAKQYDNKVVDFSGEVIGDMMIRGQYAWVNINDGQNAIGIWTTKALIKNIAYKGSYGFKGDVVEIKGKFNRSCPDHGGDLDIHAETMCKIRSGKQISESLDLDKIKIALILLGIALVFLLRDLITRKRWFWH
ncbi:MAG: DNA-binding protein [Candidatus Omnitrophota bacterium]|nr:DNA-binding protein [Candidatus Omnitrophota bacterium]